MKYKYRAIAKNGQTVEGVFDAASESDVIAMIKANSYMPLQVERDVGEEARFELFKAKVKKKDLAVFCRQFFTMIDAGLGIVKCLDILELQTENKTLRATISSVNGDVQTGLTLSEAMKKHPLIFPAILTNMVEAGEVSGNLDAILERMAVHFEKENKIENKVKGSAIYPAALMFVSIAVVIFMLVFVLPTFTSMFEGSDTPLPWPTKFLLDLSDSLKTYWYIYLGVIGLLVFGLISYKRTEEGTRFFDQMKLKIPVIK